MSLCKKLKDCFPNKKQINDDNINNIAEDKDSYDLSEYCQYGVKNEYDFSIIIDIKDYKGNIIPEHLASIYIPDKGTLHPNEEERTLFDEYYEKREFIPKPRVYKFDLSKRIIKFRLFNNNPVIIKMKKEDILLDLSYLSKYSSKYNSSESWKV